MSKQHRTKAKWKSPAVWKIPLCWVCGECGEVRTGEPSEPENHAPSIFDESRDHSGAIRPDSETLHAIQLHDVQPVFCADFMLHAIQVVLDGLLGKRKMVGNF